MLKRDSMPAKAGESASKSKPVVDPAVTQFWYEYWVLASELAPELEMPPPGQKGPQAYFVRFWPTGLPDSVRLRHKMRRQHSRVDLEFEQMGERLGEFEGMLGDSLEPDMTIEQTNQSGSVRLHVPEVDVSAAFEPQSSEVEQAIRAAQRLHASFEAKAKDRWNS